ncbi:MAG TPA: DNA repair protein RecN, partial [Mitsuokella multacida]|nr:DNA repair protein RecN [Mitsuokella multacida]
ITHLPQIACMADAHLYISKRTVEGTTATQIRPLSERERISEIARMASGADMTTASLDNAREMVSHAKMKKDAFRRDVLS